MKSPAFIRGFKRFISRRGTPEEIINDNFKTFKSKEVKTLMTCLHVRQKFILPASPWWGGFYERGTIGKDTTKKYSEESPTDLRRITDCPYGNRSND